MRPLGLGVAAALIIAAIMPVAVMSAPKTAEAIPDAARKQGMLEAPALAKTAGITCQIADARFVAKGKDPTSKAAVSYYEVDCDQGQGFIVVNTAGATPSAFTCLEVSAPTADGKPSSLVCKLPGNTDPKADLAPLLAKAGVTCTPEAARGIGQTKTTTFFEVACQGGTGYVLQAGVPANPDSATAAVDCLVYDASDSNIKCTLHDKAYRLAVVDQYTSAAKNGCVVKDRRFVGLSQSGSNYFEAACEDGKGYMYKVDKGALAMSTPCEKAAMLLGGCELTNTKEAETAQAGLYTKLAQKAGFDCQVSKYAPLPSPAGKDVVELACSNRATGGGIGVFSGPNEKSFVVDCAHSQLAGYRCSFTPESASNTLLTDDLKKMGKTACEVSKSRIIGKDAKGTNFVEVACADGLKGYVLGYSAEPIAPISVLGCAFTKDCKLPGNT